MSNITFEFTSSLNTHQLKCKHEDGNEASGPCFIA